jgi:hypothetical protein
MMCPQCEEIIASGGIPLWGACASVGIEYGRSAAEQLDYYLAAKHAEHAQEQE